jgi:hypothetical protein
VTPHARARPAGYVLCVGGADLLDRGYFPLCTTSHGFVLGSSPLLQQVSSIRGTGESIRIMYVESRAEGCKLRDQTPSRGIECHGKLAGYCSQPKPTTQSEPGRNRRFSRMTSFPPRPGSGRPVQCRDGPGPGGAGRPGNARRHRCLHGQDCAAGSAASSGSACTIPGCPCPAPPAPSLDPSPGPGRQGVSCWCPMTESSSSLLWLSVPGRVVSTTRVWARFSVYRSWASTSMRPSSGWRMVLQSP